MILFSFFYLSTSFLYLFICMSEISFLGTFYIAIANFMYCSMLIFWKIYNFWLDNYYIEYTVYNWIDLGNNIVVTLGIKEDILNNIIAFVMIYGALTVTVFVFSEMSNDKEGQSFILLLGYFVIFMLIVIGSDNLILFYLGWEGISLTSYFLVNFWSERVRSIKAVLKIFIISKIGDFFIILFICLIIINFDTVNFDIISSEYLLFFNNKFMFLHYKIYITDILGIILVFGTCVKSAQYGFHIWLLEAMEAPLGASALMHSSTLVIAGVVLLYKLSIIIELSVYSQLLMFIMGIFSATFGAFFACFQYELKVILAYSTISNMGYIFTLFSVGAYYDMFIILILHAFIKIYMFIIIGGIINHCNGAQDIRWIGNILPYVPFLWISYLIGGFALIGLPYFSGYLYKTFLINSLINNLIFLKGGEYFLLISYYLTIFYVSRLGYLVFLTSKNGHKNIYKNKKISMYYVIVIFFLGLVIIFFQYFWANLLNLNIERFCLSYTINASITLQCHYWQLSYLASKNWVFVYCSIIISFNIFNVLAVYTEWQFFKKWFWLNNFLYALFAIYYW